VFSTRLLSVAEGFNRADRALLVGGVAVGLFQEGLTVDTAVTGLEIGIAAVVPVAMAVAAVLVVLALADRWSPRQA
jgi:phosphohistidine swiveling domain-containing protein